MRLKTRASETTINGISNGTPSLNKISRLKLTEQEKNRIETLVKNAKSLQEIAYIEKTIGEGRVPGDIG